MPATSNRLLMFLLLAALMVLAPLVIFPNKLGMDLLRLPHLSGEWGVFAGVLLLELLFYGLSLFFLNRARSFGNLLGGIGLTFCFRLAIGALTGLVIWQLFSIGLVSGMTLAIYSFLPALMFQVALAPFALNQVFPAGDPKRVRIQLRDAGMPKESRAEVHSDTDRFRPAAERSVQPKGNMAVAPPYQAASIAEENPHQTMRRPLIQSGSGKGQPEINGFERATRYIGEHGSVFLAVVVDTEGLPLAGFSRGGAIIDDWAPFALVYFDAVKPALQRTAMQGLEKVDFLLKEKRIIASRIDFCTLLVIAERQSDDILHIRINQGMEIISRFVQERYPLTADATLENAYVSRPE